MFRSQAIVDQYMTLNNVTLRLWASSVDKQKDSTVRIENQFAINLILHFEMTFDGVFSMVTEFSL